MIASSGRLHRRRLGYLERLQKQYEENRLRADLEVIEEAHVLTVTWNRSWGAGSSPRPRRFGWPVAFINRPGVQRCTPSGLGATP